MTPRILFSDKNLRDSDRNVLGLIISLALKYNYCFAHNGHLVKYLNLSERTINYSLARLKKLNYIRIEYKNNSRRIYLNKEKIPLKSSSGVASNCDSKGANDCNYKINNNNKNKYIKNKSNSSVPYWMEHPEVCVKNEASPKEQAKMEELLKEFK